jgi:5'-methylthioadenosine phosphorylase
VWHESEEPVTVEAVVRTLMHNADVAKDSVANAIRLLTDVGSSPHANALQDAIITHKDAVPVEVVEKLEHIVGRYFNQ